MSSSLLYFVEGQCEKTFIKSFMFIANRLHFKQGKIEALNLVNIKLSKAKARTINKDMMVAIVFDTDVNNVDILDENIKLLKAVSQLDDNHIILVPSVKNLEDEIVYSSKLKDINDLFNSKGIAEFKKKFINHSDIVSKLDSVEFDFNLIWTRNGKPPFDKYKNTAHKIKINS